MSKTPVSELNARMSLDISPLEQAVPRALGYLKRLGGAMQAEAFTAQNLGPDARALAENIRARVKNAPDMPQFGGAKEQQALADQIAARKEETMQREARALAAQRQLQDQLAAEGLRARLAELKQEVDAFDEVAKQVAMHEAYKRDQIDQTISRMQAANEAIVAHQNQVRNSARESAAFLDAEMSRREAAARSQIEFADMQRDIVAKQAKESAAFLDAELSKLEKIADIRRKQAQIRATSEFDRANPFEQQVLASKELNRLLAVRRGLQRGTVEFAEAELAVTRQIATVRNIRDSLTAGAAGVRNLGNTAEDSLKGFSRAGLAMQQFGYQAQDFAVQVTSGTNALVALSQQGSQILGFLGGWQFALAGAALSAGILAYRLYDTATAAEEAAKKYKTNKEALEALISARRELDLLRDPSKERAYLDQDRRAALQRVEIAKIELATRQAIAAAGISADRKREIAAAQLATATLFGVEAARLLGVALEKSLAGKAAAAVAEASQNLTELDEALTKAIAKLQGLDNTETSEASSQTNSLLEKRNSLLERRDEINSRGLTLFDKLAKAQAEAESFTAVDEEGRLFLEEMNLEVDDLIQRIGEMAQGYRDSLDPLSEQKKKIEEINRLKGLGLLQDNEAALLQARIADERERQLKLPDAMRAQTGSSVAGLRNTDGTANQLVTLQQQMLSELRKLVWQGSN